MPASFQRSKRNLLARIFTWTAASTAAALLLLFGIAEWFAHRPSRVHTFATQAEIEAEDIRLGQMGLVVRGGSFLEEHPFQPPWTPHSLLVPSTWKEPGIKALLGPRNVRADLLLADLDVLQPVMARAYGGWDTAAARGWNWNRWFAEWRRQLATKGNSELSLDVAFAPMDQLLAFQRDNHTQIPLSRHTSDGSQTALLTHAPTAACTELRAGSKIFAIDPHDAGQQVRTAKLWRDQAPSFADANYIALPSSLGVPQAVLCGQHWIALQPVGARQSKTQAVLWEIWSETLGRTEPTIERIGDGIFYARLPTFESGNYKNISHQGWPHRGPSDRVLIVDLRNNGGGDASYGFDVLKGWVDQARTVTLDSVGAQINSSCLYPALRWNYPDSHDIAHDKPFKQSLLDRMAKPYPPGCPRSVDITPSKWTYLQHHFNPQPSDMRIIALVNSRCGSDCELMTEELASLPETLVVGVNTYGVSQMIQPGYSVLPHTGLPYRIALGRADPYGDNRSVDGYGLDVDVVIPDVDNLGRGSMRKLAAFVVRL